MVYNIQEIQDLEQEVKFTVWPLWDSECDYIASVTVTPQLADGAVTLEKDDDHYKLRVDLAFIPDNTYKVSISMKTSKTGDEGVQGFLFTVENQCKVTYH